MTPHTRGHLSAAEEAVRLDEEDREDDRERERELQLRADLRGVADHQRLEDADRQASDDGAHRALEPAERRSGKCVDEDRLHEGREEEPQLGGRQRHQAGHGTEDCRKPPADREHRVDANAGERR